MLPEKIAQLKQHSTTNWDEARNILEQSFATKYIQTTLNDLELHVDGTVSFTSDNRRERLPCTQIFLESLASAIRIGINYAYDCPFHLFNYNFEQRKAACTRSLTLCINRGVVINAAKRESYGSLGVRTTELLNALNLDDHWQLHRATLADEGVSISLLHDRYQLEPQPGDTIQVGMRITNSETGGQHAKATLFTLREICTNGTTITHSIGTVWWNNDKRMHQSTKLLAFTNKLINLVDHGFSAISALYDGVDKRLVREREFVNLFRRIQQIVDSNEQADRILGVPIEDRTRLQHRVRSLVSHDLGDPTPWSVFDIHNRITAAARDARGSRRRSRFTQRERLEEVGGDVLRFSLN